MSRFDTNQDNSKLQEIAPRVITFYSYKGGVGRSMAMANIAMLLARDYKLNVLTVDWDLEAPGLHRYFDIRDEALGKGVIDYLDNYKQLVGTPKTGLKPEDLLIKGYAHTIFEIDGGGSLKLIGAGSQNTKSEYINKVRSFDWEDFYRGWNGAQVIEGLRHEFLEMADVTLIDSRTGITDVGGVCTVQLPDIVVFVFVFNNQNLAGIEQIAAELSDPNNPTLKAIHRTPELLFLPCRKELSELGRLREWEVSAANKFRKFCDTPKIRELYRDAETYLRKTSVPYVPYFAYGEELAADSDKGIEMAEAFEPLIGLMLGDLPKQSGIENLLWMSARRRMFSVVRVLAMLTAILLSVLVIANFGVGAKWALLLKAGIAGILGALLAFVFGFQKFPEEYSSKRNRIYVLTSLLIGSIGGYLVGGGVGWLLPASRYLVIISIAVGWVWGVFVKVFVRFLSDPVLIAAFNKGREETRKRSKN
ncbi:MAG: hypothetical protein DMF72_02115 [Acidobacteria bacterium]|nr:MAG: hypothetical protein DMF72_02115 [Acidobacteriota bacterium]